MTVPCRKRVFKFLSSPIIHIILTGATGTVGGPVLKHAINSSKISKLSILSRKPLTLPPGSEAKAEVLLHEDYTSYPAELLDKLKGADGCIWAQGVSQTEVDKEKYITITYDYPLAAAKAFAPLSNTGKFNFVYVSGEGADPTEKTSTLFGKIKGRAKKDLLALPSSSPTLEALRIFNLRPGGVFPLNPDRQSGFLKRMSLGALVPVLNTVSPGLISPSGPLADVLIDLATGDGEPLPAGKGIEAEGRTIRSVAARRLGGL